MGAMASGPFTSGTPAVAAVRHDEANGAVVGEDRRGAVAYDSAVLVA